MDLLIPLEDTFSKTVKQDFTRYLKNYSNGAEWLIVSDYCFDSDNKKSDVATFTIIPYNSKVEEIRKFVKKNAPKDLKHTRTINASFAYYAKSYLFFHFTFAFRKKDNFMRDVFDSNILKNFFKEAPNFISGICVSNPQHREYFEAFHKRMKAILEDMKKKSFNQKMIRQIFIISQILSLLHFYINEINKAKRIIWISDRDKIAEKFDGIVHDMMFLWSILRDYDKKGNPHIRQVFINTSQEEWDDFIRIPDYIAGTIADLSLEEQGGFFFKDKNLYFFWSNIYKAPNHAVIRLNCQKNNISTARCIWGDCEEMIEEEKNFINSQSRIIIIPKADILHKNYDFLNAYFIRTLQERKVLLNAYSSFNILIDGYNNDPREIIEIPEIIEWYSRLFTENIPIIYFLNFTNSQSFELPLLISTYCEGKIIRKTENTNNVEWNIDTLDSFLYMAFNNLNQFTQCYDIPEGINRKISKNLKDALIKLMKGEPVSHV